MKLSISLFLSSLPAALAQGTNKTLAPTPGVIRPTPFPTGFGDTPEPTYVLQTPAPTDCEAKDFYFDGVECTNADFADGEQTFNTVQQCCNVNFGPGSFNDGSCEYNDICGMPPMSMDYGYILDSFGKSGKGSYGGSSGKSGKGSSSKGGKASSGKSGKGSDGYGYDEYGSSDGYGKSGKGSSGKSGKGSDSSGKSGKRSSDGYGYDGHDDSSAKSGKGSSDGKSGKGSDGGYGYDGYGSGSHSSKGSKGHSDGKSGKGSSGKSGKGSSGSDYGYHAPLKGSFYLTTAPSLDPTVLELSDIKRPTSGARNLRRRV